MKKLFTLVFAISVMLSVTNAQDGGMHIFSGKLNLESGTYLIINGDLKVSVTDGLIVPPSTYVTTKGDLTLGARKAIVVQTSTSSGTPRGSFIFNGSSVNHPNKGSMEVQSYISGSAGTNYWMHFVGAPVEDTTAGWTKKVRLQQFDMTYLDTYAFEWDATVDTSSGQPWVNVWPYWYEVAVGNGLTLSNYVAGSDTIIMEGYPVSGSVTYAIRHYNNNHLELISNPFPSAIDFDDFANENSTYIQDKYWIYSASGGNYIARSDGSGGSQYIQYGQGFFVETKASGNISFTSSYKTHNNADFRNTNPYELQMHVSGGTIGFEDDLYIRFREEASRGIDHFDAKKWNSVSAGATMIRSIAEDGSELAINMLPPELLHGNGTSVPVYFECGEQAVYTFDFSGMDSFDNETEIWLEDILDNSSWHSVSESNTTYSFNASPDDEKYRFNIHFLGPTSVTDPVVEDGNGRILIYSTKQEVYVVNKSDETIQEVAIYDMMGHEILRTGVPQQPTHKFKLLHKTGYYVVRVMTDRQVHTGKILILK